MTKLEPLGEITVRIAGPDDIHLVTRFLPEGLNHPVNTRYLIAEANGSDEVLGGAYFRVGASGNGIRVASIKLRVNREALPIETASTLLTTCLVAAESAGAGGVVYDSMVEAGSEEETLLLQAGFTSLQQLKDYEINLESTLKALARTVAHLERRGKLPPSFRLVPIDEAPITPVQALISRHVGGSLDALGVPLLKAASTVAKVDAHVVGVTVAVKKGRGVDIPYTVTDPAYRNRWVTPAMWQRTGEELVRAGYETVSYCTNGTQFKSMFNFTRRIGSQETGCQVRYGRALTQRQRSSEI